MVRHAVFVQHDLNFFDERFTDSYIVFTHLIKKLFF